MYAEPIANIKLNGEKFKAIALKSRTSQGFNQSNKTTKGNQGIQIGKEGDKVVFFVDDMVV